MNIEACRIINLPRITDPRGNLTFIEGEGHIPFAIRRTYWIYDVPGGATRGGHAYRTNEELIIAVSGSFDVVIDNGMHRETHSLNRSYYGLYIPAGQWRELVNFSTNALCLVLASGMYDEADYIRDYEAFKKFRGLNNVQRL
ncbi:MAG: FdtA/QdtA family cupin domain-containing protein [Desulfuromonadales bacterium]